MAQSGLNILGNKSKPTRSELATFREDIDLLKSNFYFILGKIEHSKNNFDEAYLLYQDSLRLNLKNY